MFYLYEAAPDQDQDQARAQDPDQPNQSPVDPNNQDGAQAEGEDEQFLVLMAASQSHQNNP